MTKHTPGPWAVYPPEMLDNKHWSVQTDCGMTIVCGEDTPEAAADAHLIAAAPELLAVVRQAIDYANDTKERFESGWDCDDEEAYSNLLAAADDAIAKAEGSSE